MFGETESFDTYKITFESREAAREFRDTVLGFVATVDDTEDVGLPLSRSAHKLRNYLVRDENEPEFDFDGITAGGTDNIFLPERRYGWALDIHDIAVILVCLGIDAEEARTLLQDIAHGLITLHADPGTSVKTEAGLNLGPYVQITEELNDDEITFDHVHFALERLYRGRGPSDFDHDRYVHPGQDIDDPQVFVSSVVANMAVEGFGTTLRYIYEQFIELGEDEVTANLRIILHELLRMSALNLDRPLVLLGAASIEEALLLESGRNPDNPDLTMDDAIKIAYDDIISKELAYACSVVHEVRNELGHTSWPSASIGAEEITLTSSLAILVLTELLDTPTFEEHELESILSEFTDHHGWDIEYVDGNFVVERPDSG